MTRIAAGLLTRFAVTAWAQRKPFCIGEVYSNSNLPQPTSKGT